MFLKIDDLTVGYGNKTVVTNASFGVEKGKITTLLGHNGAGKTTTLKAIVGVLPIQGGTISLDGKPMQGEPVSQRISDGIRLLPEGRGIFGNLTVAENLEVVAERNCSQPNCLVKVDDVIRLFPVLQERGSSIAGKMSGGQQQMLAFGLTLLGSPKCLLLDEPSIGLAPNLVERLFAQVKEVCQSFGISALLVEQNVAASIKICDHVSIMNNGEIVFNGSTEEARGSDFWQYF